MFNNARFFLSRLESLFVTQKAFQIFRGRAELAASRPMARLCALFRFAPQIPQTRLTLASALRRWWFLVTVCACGGKTLISRLNLFPSATCRGLTSLPPMAFAVSFRIRFADAKTAVKHHRPTHILPLEHHLICNLISRPKDSSQVVSIAKECILRLSPPDAFIEQVKFCNLLYDIYLLYGMDVLKTCNQLA